MGEMINAYKILVGKPEGRDHLEDLGIDGWEVWSRFIWLWITTCGGLLLTW
jgi:hypothetical protein